jgi:phosphoesterase RecJ-like protein
MVTTRPLQTLALHCGGRVVTMHLTYAQLRSGDPEDVVNHGLSIRGVEAAVLFREHAPGQYRVSLRSRERLDVSEVARLFGGGGHANAAGCRLEGALEEVQGRLLEGIGQRLA